MAAVTPEVRQLFFELQFHLDEIAKLFKSPKMTLVVRAPELVDGDVVIGNDDLDSAIASINKLKARTPQFKPAS